MDEAAPLRSRPCQRRQLSYQGVWWPSSPAGTGAPAPSGGSAAVGASRTSRWLSHPVGPQRLRRVCSAKCGSWSRLTTRATVGHSGRLASASQERGGTAAALHHQTRSRRSSSRHEHHEHIGRRGAAAHVRYWLAPGDGWEQVEHRLLLPQLIVQLGSQPIRVGRPAAPGPGSCSARGRRKFPAMLTIFPARWPARLPRPLQSANGVCRLSLKSLELAQLVSEPGQGPSVCGVRWSRWSGALEATQAACPPAGRRGPSRATTHHDPED